MNLSVTIQCNNKSFEPEVGQLLNSISSTFNTRYEFIDSNNIELDTDSSMVCWFCNMLGLRGYNCTTIVFAYETM